MKPDGVLVHDDVAAAADHVLVPALVVAGDAADLTGIQPQPIGVSRGFFDDEKPHVVPARGVVGELVKMAVGDLVQRNGYDPAVEVVGLGLKVCRRFL